MPNYIYRCTGCSSEIEVTLPISYNPRSTIECPHCYDDMKRIIKSFPAVKGLKTFAGDWFKKTYGHELGERKE